MNVPCANTTQTIWEPDVKVFCNHSPRCKECGNESNATLSISFKEQQAAILSVTTYYEGGSMDYVCYEKTNKVYLKGMFPEGMHNKMLKIKILVAFKGRVFEVPIYCDVVKVS